MTGLFDDVVSTPPRNHAELLRVIRGVRRRWRLKVALRGAAIVLGFAAVPLWWRSLGRGRRK